MSCIASHALLGIVFSGVSLAAERATSPPSLRFELSFPASVRSERADGRVFVVVAREGQPEPRLQFGKAGEQYRSTPFFGEDVEGLRPGQWATVGDGALGYPVARLADLPVGDYFVQVPDAPAMPTVPLLPPLPASPPPPPVSTTPEQ